MPRLEPELIAQRMREYQKKRDEIINTNGWFIQGVFGDESRPILWNYTIGMLDKFGFELIMFAVRLELAAKVMNDLGADFNVGARPVCDMPIVANKWFQGEVWMMYRNCTPTEALYTEWCAQATYYHNRDNYPVIQIVLADKNGKFPGEPGFDAAVMDRAQPLLYKR